MSAPEYEWTFTIKIIVKGTVTKKNTFRDNLTTTLQNAKTAGNIDSAEWDCQGEIAKEGGKI
jgi:hypothetical protein